KPFCEKTREIWVKTHEFGAKSALLDGKMGKMSTEISNSSNGVAKMGYLHFRTVIETLPHGRVTVTMFRGQPSRPPWSIHHLA
ncbi:MAG: hypothetical protein OXD43_14210, partial [Bacteroidetes bacterium]|nr:hypothetical protein [Bacteroidota bacterium]